MFFTLAAGRVGPLPSPNKVSAALKHYSANMFFYLISLIYRSKSHVSCKVYLVQTPFLNCPESKTLYSRRSKQRHRKMSFKETRGRPWPLEDGPLP